MNKTDIPIPEELRDVQRKFQEDFSRGYNDWMNEHVGDAYKLGRQCAQRDYFIRHMQKMDECIKYDFSQVTCGRSVL